MGVEMPTSLKAKRLTYLITKSDTTGNTAQKVLPQGCQPRKHIA
jgi:hypothetical protein